MSLQAPERLNAENPWPGLRQFDEFDREFFRGRENETAKLLRLVNDAPLTVLFGASGLGKSSLLLAGLMPRLREQHKLPIYVRLNPLDRCRPLIDQVYAKFCEELEAKEVDHAPFRPDESLWEYLHRPDFELWSKTNQLLTPLFILDQFEEIFTLGSANRGASERLREDLADLVENLVPPMIAKRYEQSQTPASFDLHARRCKILLSFREDFLAQAETWRSAIPSLSKNRIRLEPMSGEQATNAIVQVGRELVDRATAHEIVKFVAAARTELRGERWTSDTISTEAVADTGELEIEPALLSLVCTKLNERRKEAHKTKIDQSLLVGTTKIVEEFYQECLRDLPDRVGVFIDTELVTESGVYRNAFSRQDAFSRGALTQAELDILVNRRLLRIEPRLGEPRIELIHDVLVPVARKFRDLRRTKEELTRKKIRIRRKIGVTFATLFAIVSVTGIVRNRQLLDGEAEHTEALQKAHHGEYKVAVAKLSDALSKLQTWRGDRGDILRVTVDRGKIFALLKQNDNALQDLTDALLSAKASPSVPAEEALALEALASFYAGTKEGTKAAENYNSALDKYKESGDSASIARILEWKASIEEEAKQFEQANGDYELAQSYYKILGDGIGISRTVEAVKRTVAWGYLTDLKLGAVYRTHGVRFTIGRDVPQENIKNDLNFSTTGLVSRRHLEVTHFEDGRQSFGVEDFRSRNGSTLNATILPYGRRQELRDNDIITLANDQILQFTTKQAAPVSVPKSAWAIFIDGSSRKHFYLTEPAYSVARTPDGWAAQLEGAGSEILKIRKQDEKGTPDVAVEAHWSLCIEGKVTDYTYGYEYLTKKKFERIFKYIAHLVPKTQGRAQPCGGLPFQIILFSQSVGR